MDKITKKQRSWNMSRIRSKNTQPERAVRKFLSEKKIIYRLHAKKLPGKPDIVINKEKKVIFINGCFWHQHKNCKKQAMPKANIKYWKDKLRRNAEKQRKDILALKKLGWKVGIIWECKTKRPEDLSKTLQKML